MLPPGGRYSTPRCLHEARCREGSYLLRSNVTGSDQAQLWGSYLQLAEVEQAQTELKGDLATMSCESRGHEVLRHRVAPQARLFRHRIPGWRR